MLLKSQNTINTIVSSFLKESELFKGVVINISISYLEHFENPINQSLVKDLQKKYPEISFNESYANINNNYNLLFVKRDGYFACYSNINDFKPQDKKESKWKFQTGHSSCWRENAHLDIEDSNSKVRDTFFEIFKDLGSNVLIPRHIVPNFSMIDNIEFIDVFKYKSKEIAGSKNLLIKNQENKFEIKTTL